MDDRHLDELIDVVARQMTAGEPRDGFRARVIARLETGFGSRDSGFAGERDEQRRERHPRDRRVAVLGEAECEENAGSRRQSERHSARLQASSVY